MNKYPYSAITRITVIGITCGLNFRGGFFMSEIISIVSLAVNVIALALILLGILLGIKRGLLHSSFRLAAVILAAGVSIIVARVLRSAVANLISELLLEGQLDPTVQEVLNASPTATELVTKLPGALIAPLIFFICFLLLNFIFYLIYKIPKRLTRPLKQKIAQSRMGKMQLDRVFGAIVSVAASFLIVACFLAPFSGYVSFADEIVTELENVSIDKDVDSMIVEIDEDYLTPVKNNVALSVAGTVMNPIVFDAVTSSEINGYDVVWSGEIAYLADTYGTVKPLIDTGFDLGQFGESEATALRAFAENFDNSVLIPHIIAELLPTMAANWNRGEDFIGIENPANSAPSQLQPMMGTMVDVLETTTYETLPEDITTLTELLATLSESGTLTMFGEDISAQDIVTALSKPGLISGLIDNLYLNEHMRALVTDIANLGFDAISSSLNIPTDSEAVRAELSVKINDAVQKTDSIDDYDGKITSLSADIGNLFEKYGVSSDKDTAKLYAECIVGVGPIATDNADSITVDYFTIINTALNEELANLALTNAPVYARTPVNAKVKEAVAAYLATAGNDAAQNAAKIANQIRGEEKLQHAVITLEDIHLSAEEMGMMSMEDIHKQSQSLEDIVTILSTVMTFDEEGAFSIDIQKIDANALSDALFRLSSTGTDAEGHEVHNIAHAITGVVKYSLYQVGINAAAANDLVNHMTTERTDETKKNPLSSALVVLTVVQPDQEMTADEMKENITTMVQDLDKETAKVLSDCISTNLLNSFISNELPAEQTDAIVTVTKDIINSFGEQTENLTEEQLEAESAYIQTIFDLAVNANQEQTDPLFSTEENDSSKLNMSADDFVDTIKHSVIISNTVVNETESLKTAINNGMPESDKELLLEAIEKDTELSEDLKNALLDVFQLDNLASGDLPSGDLGDLGK